MNCIPHKPFARAAALVILPVLIALGSLSCPWGTARGELIDTTTKLNPEPGTVAELNFEPAMIGREERYMQNLSRSWAGPELFIRQILLDESWDEWIAYQKSLHPYIPMQSLKLILRSNRRLPGMIGSAPPQDTTSKQSQLAAGKSLNELEKQFFIYTKKHQNDISGFISFDPDMLPAEAKKWNWIAFMLEDDGILSGEEWDLDNFLPRLATVAVFVTLLFILTENFRYIVRLGRRTFKRR